MKDYPAHEAPVPEDWLVDVAIARGLSDFVRDAAGDFAFNPPPATLFSNEELIVALCYQGGLDRPQLIRMAGRLISKLDVNLNKLMRWIIMERAENIIAELARAALHCNPDHPRWKPLWQTFSFAVGTRSPVIHWNRLAEPRIDQHHRIQGWRLAT